MSNPMSGGDGTVETMAAHSARVTAAGVVERERIARVNEGSRANHDAYHSGDAEYHFLADLAQRGVHVHSDEGRAEIAAFRAHPSQLKA